jgi:hypothetical protein
MSQVITDAELVSQFAQQAMEEPEKVITSRAPSDTTVDLPGGYISQDGTVVKTAEVRELNGADEEAISKAGSKAKALGVLLQRGLVKVGTEDATKEMLDSLLSGDRDAILIGIRKVTFGDELKAMVHCYSCNEDQETVVTLSEDVPVRELNDLKGRSWVIETKKGPVAVGLPNGLVQKKLMDNADKTSAEINTLLLSGCVMSVNGSPSMGAHTVLSLGMTDRANIVDEIIENNPGPRLGEVKKACRACGEDMNLPLSLLDLFQL